MDMKEAVFLAKLMEKASPTDYEIKKMETIGGSLPKFHQWTNNKKTYAAYEVKRPASDTGYYFIFIDWHRNDIYYLVIYAHDRSTTVAELRQVQEIDGSPHLVWTYKPFKRDGKNDVRKAYFKQMFGTTTVEIKLPKSPAEVEEFYKHIFNLCQNRVKADRIVDKFDFDIEERRQ
ncbi:hypothetical protein HPT25_11345 [Bacillus sp. BRMEA1]|uniref:hypothetical protein n=1 Tax=Neobacillus endophyticus TaxID=2738405 RepID=UPI001565F2E1|nr:hypothetical protein [Neobacillus endophyticus]NRD77979.1 hypothetical protein [Neobacillus endophyticus]